LLIVSPGEDGWPDPEASVRALADSGLYDLLLEGGPSLAGSWWRAGVVARGVVYIGARIGGGQGLSPLGGEFATMAQSRDVTIEEVRRVGPDVRIEFS
jgi:diaminohydroxyphosphoribosylaminopyrimidine deaminase/5-amino-6-(5-phosphoribosylamino)uracil reductase